MAVNKELVPFTPYMPRKNRLDKVGGGNIDKMYLLKLWNKQDGCCAMSGITMIHPYDVKNTRDKLLTASLDRIDNAKGYVKGNVQFVLKHLNLMRHTLTVSEANHFLEIVSGAIQNRSTVYGDQERTAHAGDGQSRNW